MGAFKMKRQKTADTMIRQWHMLREIPVEPRMRTYVQIRDQLACAGYVIDENTVRRDLQKLQEVFPIVIDVEGSPHLCYWKKGKSVRLPGFSPFVSA